MVEGRREARTVEAMRAALVDREAGNLKRHLAVFLLNSFIMHKKGMYNFFSLKENCAYEKGGEMGAVT